MLIGERYKVESDDLNVTLSEKKWPGRVRTLAKNTGLYSVTIPRLQVP